MSGIKAMFSCRTPTMSPGLTQTGLGGYRIHPFYNRPPHTIPCALVPSVLSEFAPGGGTSSSLSVSRLHQLLNTLNSLKGYSAEEVELAWRMSQLSGHAVGYASDPTGLMYLAGSALAGEAQRHLQLVDPPYPIRQDLSPIYAATGEHLNATA